MRLSIVLASPHVLNPRQLVRIGHDNETIAVNGECDVHLVVIKVTRRRLALPGPDIIEELCVRRGPVLSRVTRSIQAQLEQSHHVLVAWLLVFIWDLYVDRYCRWGVEVGAAHIVHPDPLWLLVLLSLL